MTENKNSKKYDLEERTFQFAKNVRIFVKNFLEIFLILKMESK